MKLIPALVCALVLIPCGPSLARGETFSADELEAIRERLRKKRKESLEGK